MPAALRVVSLLPSATELLCAAGGGGLLVGRSHECDWPPSIRDLPVLTGQRTLGIGEGGDSASIDAQVRAALARGESLYTLDEARLRGLRPDVILTQDLCEVCSIDLRRVERVAATMTPSPAVVSLDPRSIEEVFDDLLKVGEATGLAAESEVAMVRLREEYWSAVDFVNPYVDGPEVAFLEWIDPLFVAGHWTPQLITAAGGRHALNAAGAKSRSIAPAELVESQPDRIVVSPCGLDVGATLRELERVRGTRWWNALPAVVEGRVAVVDGNQMFSRPGPRLVDAFRWLVGWINDRPEVVPADFPVRMLTG
ncbi:MAG TPA: ABC transporter substrate-binding protein [Phycisphaerales bacterium]|nr:ABC transporter substrate-binding protein [Phycisphaerales bacterium]HMP38011.1 ABC transporter substrate-binding protein [Phycisphaerales bacterium]